MRKLHLKPRLNSGLMHSVYPANLQSRCPGWSYVGFEVHRLMAGESLGQVTQEREHLLVVLAGTMKAKAGGEVFDKVGGRKDVFTGEKAHALYIPGESSWSIEALEPLEVAVCSAPYKGGHHGVRHIAPDNTPIELRGKGLNSRKVNAIMMEERAWADSLLVTEVWTPGGHSSSYPSHKHDTDDYPNETYLEETYYHRINPGTGFGFQRVYDRLSLNETMAVYDRDLILVPRGYHPCAALYGHDMYYLNVMAGPLRKWRFTNDPDHDWLYQRDMKKEEKK